MKSEITQNSPVGLTPYYVPVTAQANEFVPELCKVPYDYLFRDDPVSMAECALLAQEYTGLDLLVANLDIYNFEAESAGAKMLFYKDHIPDVDRSNLLIKEKADLEKIKFRGLDSGRYRYLIAHQNAYTEYCGKPAFPFICAPFSLASNLYGIDNLLVSIMTEPVFAHELLRRVVEDLLIPAIRALCASLNWSGKITLADAYASAPMISPEIAEEYVERYTELLNRELAIPGVKASSGGYWGVAELKGEDINRFLDFKIRVGGSLSVTDPDLSSAGPRFFREYATEKNVDLKFGISSQFLQSANVPDIVERVREYILVGKDGPTPLALSINSICPLTPLENLHAAIEAVRTYGAPCAIYNKEFVMTEKRSFEEFLKEKIENNISGYRFKWLETSLYKSLFL